MNVPGPAPSVPGWDVIGPLGKGGMGTVWKARRADGLVAAIKVARPSARLTPAQQAAHFRREAQACLHLDHPNLVRGLDVGTTADGRPYLALEHVEGRTLARAIEDEGALPEAQVVAAGAGLARGLDHAHRAGLVHRDVKPSNVMLLPGGGVKLLDLGLVAESEAAPGGPQLATRAFCAPERLVRPDADPRSDLFSLGATLAAAAVGRIPTTRGVWDDGRLPETVDGRALSPGFRAVVERLLRSDPRQRYASAAELALDLDALADGERPLGAILRAGAALPSRTRRVRRIAVAAALVAAAASAGVLVARDRRGPVPAPAPSAPTPAAPAPPDARLAAARAFIERFPGDFASARVLLDAADAGTLSDVERSELARLREDLEARHADAADAAAADLRARADAAWVRGDVAEACRTLRDWPAALGGSAHAAELAALAAKRLADAQANAARLADEAEALARAEAPDADAALRAADAVAAALARPPFDGDVRDRLARVAASLASAAETACARRDAERAAADARARWAARVAAAAAARTPEAVLELLRADSDGLPAETLAAARRVRRAAESATRRADDAVGALRGRFWAGPRGGRLVVGASSEPPDARDVVLSPLWHGFATPLEVAEAFAAGRDAAAAWLLVHGAWDAAAAASADVARVVGDVRPARDDPPEASSAGSEFALRAAFAWRAEGGPAPRVPADDAVLSAWAACVGGRTRPPTAPDTGAAGAKAAGHDAFLRDDLATAWERLTDAAQRDPWDAEVAALRARIALVGARSLPTVPGLVFALSEARRAADLDPRLPAALAIAAEAGIELCELGFAGAAGRTRPIAAALCERAADFGRDDARFLVFAGEWHLGEGRADRAAALLRRASAKPGADGATLLALARAELAAGRRERARDALQRAAQAYGGKLPPEADELAAAVAK